MTDWTTIEPGTRVRVTLLKNGYYKGQTYGVFLGMSGHKGRVKVDVRHDLNYNSGIRHYAQENVEPAPRGLK